MVTRIETGMIEDGLATVAQVAAIRALFIGTVHEFPFVPDDPWWLPCFGQTLEQADYPELAARFGIMSGTFTLPDDRGRVVAGVDDMGGTSANRLTGQAGGVNGDVLGATGGSEGQALSIAQMPSHSHGGATGNGGTHNHDLPRATGTSGPDLAFQRVSTTTPTDVVPTTTVVAHTHSIASQGSGQAHNNVQPTIVRYKCILAY
jgi:microcystin-dependent protein